MGPGTPLSAHGWWALAAQRASASSAWLDWLGSVCFIRAYSTMTGIRGNWLIGLFGFIRLIGLLAWLAGFLAHWLGFRLDLADWLF